MAQFIYTMNRVGKVVTPKRIILRDISLSFFPGAKIGVLGLNGSGKSTLLKIMSGIDKDIEGEARAQAGIKVGYLPQEPLLDETKTVREVVGEGVGDVQSLIDRFNAISDRFAEPIGGGDDIGFGDGRDDELRARGGGGIHDARFDDATHADEGAVAELVRDFRDGPQGVGRGHRDFHRGHAAGHEGFRGFDEVVGGIGANDRDDAGVEHAFNNLGFGHGTSRLS